MTNQTAPTGSFVAPGSFPTNKNGMADIIDSLKRLERVGSENSKTTQKLIEAATELSNLIGQYFMPGPEETVHVARLEIKGVAVRPGWAIPGNHRTYTVVRASNNRSEPILCCNGEFIAKNRQEAFRFSEDLADHGLLEKVIVTITARLAETQSALGPIRGALDKIRAEHLDSITLEPLEKGPSLPPIQSLPRRPL